MSKKIISMIETYGYTSYEMPKKILEQDKEFEGMIWIEGQSDPEWSKYSTATELITIDNRRYYSVVEECTLEMLQSTIDFKNNPHLTLENYDIKEHLNSIEMINYFVNYNSKFSDLNFLKSQGFFDNLENFEEVENELNVEIQELKKIQNEKDINPYIGISST